MLFYLLGDFLSGTGMLNCDLMSVQCPMPMWKPVCALLWLLDTCICNVVWYGLIWCDFYHSLVVVVIFDGDIVLSEQIISPSSHSFVSQGEYLSGLACCVVPLSALVFCRMTLYRFRLWKSFKCVLTYLTAFVLPVVTLWDWQDVKIQSLTNLLCLEVMWARFLYLSLGDLWFQPDTNHCGWLCTRCEDSVSPASPLRACIIAPISPVISNAFIAQVPHDASPWGETTHLPNVQQRVPCAFPPEDAHAATPQRALCLPAVWQGVFSEPISAQAPEDAQHRKTRLSLPHFPCVCSDFL